MRPTSRTGVSTQASVEKSQDLSTQRSLFQCTNPDGVRHECGGGPETCCGWGCRAPGDECCTNANNDQFPCHGSCCGNACAAPGSKCCKVGNFTEWYPVSQETECRSPSSRAGISTDSSSQRRLFQCINLDGAEHECGGGPE